MQQVSIGYEDIVTNLFAVTFFSVCGIFNYHNMFQELQVENSYNSFFIFE